MEWVEITGKTVEEAQEKALDLLGVAEDDAEIEILTEPKMGLFGRVREEARVRVRVQPEVPRSKDDKHRKRRAPSRAAEAGAPPARPEPAPAAAERQTNGAPAREGRSRARVAVAAHEPADREPAAHEPADREPASHEPASHEPRMEGTMSDDRIEVPVAEQAEVAKDFVDGLLAIMAVDGATTKVVLLEEDTAELQITGGDLGLLIGPKGATLLALQDLARTVVQRRTGARTGRLLLDVAGYRQKRKEALQRFTNRVVEDVVASGTPTALEPMNSADRKIVHDTVNAIDGVTTTSEGEDPRRHVVVHPA